MLNFRTRWLDVTMKADAARDSGNFPEAEQHYELALSLEIPPERAGPYWVQLGHVRKEQGKLESAEEAYLKAVEIMPSDPDVHLQLGHLYKLRKRMAAAQTSYMRCVELDHGNQHARAELMAMGWDENSLSREPKVALDDSQSSKTLHSHPCVMIDITDLLDYLCTFPIPTGIQRVQWELARHYLLVEKTHVDIRFVYFNRHASFWAEIPVEQLLLILTPSSTGQAKRTLLAKTLIDGLAGAELISIPMDARIFVPGATWSISNFYLAVREAKQKYNARCISFVHDCIPVLFPEYCTEDVVTQYLPWIQEVLENSDLILSNSENTKQDLTAVAKRLGASAPAMQAVPLNGRFDNPGAARSSTLSENERLLFSKLRGFSTRGEPYALVVSTVEPRKNHLLLLQAWASLIKRRAQSEIPTLVCAGSRGWNSDIVYQFLASNKALRSKVIMTDRVSDEALVALYKNCEFTIYPSHYEGWGLPVSESIAYGKVPLVARNSSLAEAGGDNAVYFDANSLSDLLDKLATTMLEPRELNLRQQAVLAKPNVRSWADIGDQVLYELLHSVGERPRDGVAQIEIGELYSFQRNSSDSLENMQRSGLQFRATLGWWPAENWGCWTKEAGAEVRFRVPSELAAPCSGKRRDLRVYLKLKGCPNIENTVSISAGSERGARISCRLLRNASLWVPLTIKAANTDGTVCAIGIQTDEVDDFGEHTLGRDVRRVGIGLVSLVVCWHDDVASRTDVLESILLGGGSIANEIAH